MHDRTRDNSFINNNTVDEQSASSLCKNLTETRFQQCFLIEIL